jgi:hypothetical protein
MKRWHGSCIGALLVLLIGGGPLLFFVPVLGATLLGVPPVFDLLTGWAVCPGAVSIEKDQFNFGPTTTSPSGPTGHNEEWTCTFADGTQKIVPNEEILLKGAGASVAAVAICGGSIVLVLMIVAAIIGGRLVKPSA